MDQEQSTHILELSLSPLRFTLFLTLTPYLLTLTIVGMPIALWLSFFAGFDFKGLWLGLMAAQASCMVTMLFVLARTNWEGQAQGAQELTSSDSSKDKDEDDEEEEEAAQKMKLET
ncbi:hypothetical protein K1719_027213 [Acacia pycnantha]|nr:hypothetical protein K1719_027213 [Acacia pycnantha]